MELLKLEIQSKFFTSVKNLFVWIKMGVEICVGVVKHGWEFKAELLNLLIRRLDDGDVQF